MRGRLITVCGLIGSGKSTFTQDLSDMLGAVPLTEPAGDDRNPYLSRFYEDRKRWAFTMQTHLLQQRSEVHQRAMEETMSGRDVVMDSSVWQDMAYADMLSEAGDMNPDEYRTYLSIARMVSRTAVMPDAIIYLEVPIMECLERINLRMGENDNRVCESRIESKYLNSLQTCIKRNIYPLPNKVFMPWGDYIPSTPHRRLRIQNLWPLVEEVCPEIALD
ncbi:MAG: deoxynucleoside kinase [Planctomycetota bacterium]|nr:deoxynucleoside kinase [Planctomycetota bacterium]